MDKGELMRGHQIVTAADLGIEPVTIFRAGGDRYRNMEPREDSTARMIPISLARVRWLEREDVCGDVVLEDGVDD